MKKNILKSLLIAFLLLISISLLYVACQPVEQEKVVNPEEVFGPDFEPGEEFNLLGEYAENKSARDWLGYGNLISCFSNAPSVGGVKPSSPTAVTYCSNIKVYVIVKGDKYWLIDSNGWAGQGYLSVFNNAPSVGGQKPTTGITALYYNSGYLCLVRGNKYWMWSTTTGLWGSCGYLSTAWSRAPSIDGVKPYYPTAVAYCSNIGNYLIIQNNRYWYRKSSGSWEEHGYLSEIWNDAPSNEGYKPTSNVTAVYYDGGNIAVLRNSKYWVREADIPIGDNATCVSHDMPYTMIAGNQYDVSITMKNTGTSTWTKSANYILEIETTTGTPSTEWGLGKVYLSNSDNIRPGQQKTFSFTVTAPFSSGQNFFCCHMKIEGDEKYWTIGGKKWVETKVCNTVDDLMDEGFRPRDYGQSTKNFVEAADAKKWTSLHDWMRYECGSWSVVLKGLLKYGEERRQIERYKMGRPDWEVVKLEAQINYINAKEDLYILIWWGKDNKDAGKEIYVSYPDPIKSQWGDYTDWGNTKTVKMRYTFLNMWDRFKKFENASVCNMNLNDNPGGVNNHVYNANLGAGNWNINITTRNISHRAVYYASCNNSFSVQRNADFIYAVCFGTGTKIPTPNGYRNIEDLKAGDLVLSRSVGTGELGYKPIIEIKEKTTYDTVTLDVEGEKIVTTPIHQFWTGKFEKTVEKNSKQWIQAKNIKLGMELLNSSSNTIKIKHSPIKEQIQEGKTVYNIMVDDWHTYFVGKNELFVHNSNRCRYGDSLTYIKYMAKLTKMGKPEEGTVRSQLPIPYWMDYIPIINEMYLFPVKLAQALKDYGSDKISGGEAVFEVGKIIGKHYVDEVGKRLFPGVKDAIDFAKAFYDLHKHFIPPNERR